MVHPSQLTHPQQQEKLQSQQAPSTWFIVQNITHHLVGLFLGVFWEAKEKQAHLIFVFSVCLNVKGKSSLGELFCRKEQFNMHWRWNQRKAKYCPYNISFQLKSCSPHSFSLPVKYWESPFWNLISQYKFFTFFFFFFCFSKHIKKEKWYWSANQTASITTVAAEIKN